MMMMDEKIPPPSSGNLRRTVNGNNNNNNSSDRRHYTRRRTHSPTIRHMPVVASPPSSLNGKLSSWRQPRRHRRFTTTTTTTWLGWLLFGLVMVYALIVVLVTRHHVVDVADVAEHHDNNNNDNNNHHEHVLPNNNAPVEAIPNSNNHLKNNNLDEAEEFRKSLNANAEKQQLQQSNRKNHTKSSPMDQQKQVTDKNKGDIDPEEDNNNNKNVAPPHRIDPENLFQITPADIAAAAPLSDDLSDEAQQHPTPHRILTAYLEPVDYEDWFTKIPLPNRSDYTARASLLTKRTYSRVHQCSKLTQQWPADPTTTCPTDGDPYLPWIHDVIASADGRHVHFVAQNRRRCDTGRHDDALLRFRQGQVALFQHVPVRRVNSTTTTTGVDDEPRFQLTTHAAADPDGRETRFLCRFSNGDVVPSIFHFDYDWTAYRKRYKATFHENDGGIKSIHTSQLLFSCPLPPAWHERVRTGQHVQRDWTEYFVDLIPIRTPPRYGKPTQFLQPRYAADDGRDVTPDAEKFDPLRMWGPAHVLPRIVDSGRWANIPICLPSLLQYERKGEEEKAEDFISQVKKNEDKDESPPATVVADPLDVHHQYPPPQKKHRIVSCLWASAGYRTRGERFAINDGQRRLLEWITYHQDVLGFDHVYLYDNSGAFTNETSLKPVADMFPDTVTYIGWPSQICNNRPNNVDSPGERSSQYAAESSCRLRFGPHVDWIGQFDVDEYLVPMGDYQNIGQLLDRWDEEDTRIVSFASWRAWPRWSMINPIVPIDDREMCGARQACFDLSVPAEHTFFQTYNCDRFMPGKKRDSMPAEKQIYRAAYVYQHFVHYSAVTELSVKNSTEYQAAGFRFPARPFPDPRQRFGKEQDEALMIHTKAIARQDTAGWENVCHVKALERPVRARGLCRLGVPWPEPWPDDPQQALKKSTDDGWMYNCFVNPKAERVFAPKLRQALEARAPMLGPQSYKERR